jgi:hypothetical protein
MLAGVKGHPPGELAQLGQRGEQSALDRGRVATLAQQQGHGAELRADVGEVGTTAVGVIEALQQRDALLDLLQQRVADPAAV